MFQLDIDIRPGIGAGPFNLGQSLWSVINHVREDRTTYPMVDLQWDTDSPAASPIILRTPHIDLLFSPLSQRLSMITIHGLRASPPLTLKYKDTVISSWTPDNQASVVLRRKDIGNTFGPTYPGDSMRYPGVLFIFEEDGDQAKGLARPNPDGDRTAPVRRIVVAQKSDKDALDEPDECAAMHGELSLVKIRVHEGVDLYFHPNSDRHVSVRLGKTSVQDLTLDVGAPLRVYYKEDDRMDIHSSPKQQPEDVGSDYFYNYLQYGLDFLISGSTHIVKKVILHSNVPGSPMFQRYQRCPWQFARGDDDKAGPSFTYKLDAVQEFVSPNLREKPLSMHHDRTEDEDIALPSTTRLVAFDGVVLETAGPELVLTVTLF